MKKFRSAIAAAMAAVYLLTAPVSPLTAMLHGDILTAGERTCSGDCDICGCSLERRLAGTCCCVSQRQQAVRMHGSADRHHQVPECCRKDSQPVDTPVIASCGCPGGNHKDIAPGAATGDEALPCPLHRGLPLPATGHHRIAVPVLPPPPFAEPPDPPPRHAPPVV